MSIVLPPASLSQPSAASLPRRSGGGSSGEEYLPALDGLRAVSILLVVFSHLGLERIVPGNLGVTIFFFISGFIITRMLLREAQARDDISLPAFYTRRVFRLAPALFVYLALTVAAFAALGNPIPGRDVVAALLYFANYYHIYFNWGDQTVEQPLSIMWSLAVEEHFYILFPFIVLLLRRRLKLLLGVLVGVCVVALAWRFAVVSAIGIEQLNTIRTSEATDTRIDSIAYGCLVAVFLAVSNATNSAAAARIVRGLGSWPMVIVGGAGLMLFSLLYRDPTFRETWRYSIQGLALIPVFAHLFARPPSGLLNAALTQPLMVYCGKISYSLYLYHWFAVSVVREAFPNDSWPQVALIAVPMMLALSMASYHFVERPMRRTGHRLAQRFVAPAQAAPA
ncbi:acyltransferase family protein [Caldimonas sp. KR1-144]|uniref:acyltransferase family protein n=1 Tax=Caldimonas sp. KR1-144 TaxID=3400911 RepID=UPI003BFE1BE8